MEKVNSKNINEISTEDIGELTNEEMQLIWLIRNRFKYGDITINVRAGQPFRILKAFESTDLA